MRVNVYAEELSNRVHIVEKKIGDQTFTGLRFYLELPVSLHSATVIDAAGVPSNADNADLIREAPEGLHLKGPFLHGEDDDDSAAVTFWGKQDFRAMLRHALAKLDAHYEKNR